MATTPAADRTRPATLAVIAVGGALGALVRYGAVVAWPTVAGSFPVTIFAVNVVGCALMGVLMVVVTDMLPGRPLLRPFLGTGVLGGFTTFSAYAADGRLLFNDGRPAAALAYLLGTAVSALTAVLLAMTGTRRVLRRRRGAS